MSSFSTINKAPGVYIQEVKTLGPIAGVGTSTAAFVGVARSGPIRTPVRLANWNEFVDNFGKPDDLGGYFPDLLVQSTFAVAGFFGNGGSDCWYVRIGTAKRSSLTLADRSAAANPTLVVEAKAEGVAGDGITVAVQAHMGSTVATVKDSTVNVASLAQTNRLELPSAAEAQKFAVGDWLFVDDGANHDRARVTAITDATLEFAAPLTHAYAVGTPVRIADLAAGQLSLRVDDVTGFQAGSGIELAQGGTTESNVISAVDAATRHLTLERGIAQAYPLQAAAAPLTVVTQEFTLVIGGTETYPNLSLDPRHSNYFAAKVDSPRVTVRLADNPPNSSRAPDNLPADLPATNLAGGADDDPGAVDGNAYKEGIDDLRAIDEVNMLCVPDRTDQDVQLHMISHCESLADRFAILDPQRRATSADIQTQRGLLGSDRGYAALYYPRIVISDPRAAGRITVAPSGHVAGLYARVDGARGVFKAPANEALEDVLDLERTLVDETQGPLNEDGINVIRRFPGRGVVVWGARTISQDTSWRYVNVRRLLLFIEESLQEGTQFVVFEPNTPTLWQQVKRQVSEFLTRQWTAGALVGVTAKDAFQVICDASLNTPGSMALGQLIIEVRLYPAPPAEFVVFRIVQRPGGPEIQE